MIVLDAPRPVRRQRAVSGDRVVVIDGARIAGVFPAPPPSIDAEPLPPDTILAPGFVDLQVNGGGGVLFNDAPDPSALRRIAAAHARLGTTTFWPRSSAAPRGPRRSTRRGARGVRAGIARHRRRASRGAVHWRPRGAAFIRAPR